MNKLIEKIIAYKYAKDTKEDKQNEKAFIAALDKIYKVSVSVFVVFAIISFTLFVQHEVIR